jgi:endonuclease/exonuclease/phosphatase family metal-dependent hydrolase
MPTHKNHTAWFALLALLAWPLTALSAEYRCREGATPPAVHEQPELRVASLNIAHGRGDALNQMLIGQGQIEDNLDAAGTLMTKTGAQVVALQELDVESLWSGGFDHARRLLDASHHDCVTIGLHARTWLYLFGTGLLSSVSLTDPRMTTFEPTPPTTTKGLVSATLHWRDGEQIREVRLASVHLDFSRKKAREKQLEEIISAINESPVPIIIMGDFNEPWDDDSVVRRLVEEAGLVAFQPDAENLATYKDKRLDWILTSAELEFVEYAVLDQLVSDHRLVVARLRWRGES